MEDDNLLVKAIEALKTFKSKKENTLLEEKQELCVVIGLVKIPQKTTRIRIQLPHKIKSRDEDICLFVKDLNKHARDYEQSIAQTEELLEKNKVTCIDKIIPLKSLKIEYNSYEARRKLSHQFDIFLADKCIMFRLPSLLGKHFHNSLRGPTGIDIEKNLNEEIDRVLHQTSFCFKGGASNNTQVPFASLDMKSEEIIANFKAAKKVIMENVPGGLNNIRSLHLKSPVSISLPVYASLNTGNDVDMAEESSDSEWEEPEDVAPIEGVLVKAKKGDFKLVAIKEKKVKTLRSAEPTAVNITTGEAASKSGKGRGSRGRGKRRKKAALEKKNASGRAAAREAAAAALAEQLDTEKSMPQRKRSARTAAAQNGDAITNGTSGVAKSLPVVDTPRVVKNTPKSSPAAGARSPKAVKAVTTTPNSSSKVQAKTPGKRKRDDDDDDDDNIVAVKEAKRRAAESPAGKSPGSRRKSASTPKTPNTTKSPSTTGGGNSSVEKSKTKQGVRKPLIKTFEASVTPKSSPSARRASLAKS